MANIKIIKRNYHERTINRRKRITVKRPLCIEKGLALETPEGMYNIKEKKIWEV